MSTDEKQFYCLTLDDYAVPSFCSFEAWYFGTLPLITSLIEELKADEKYSKNHAHLIEAFREYCNGNTKVTHNVAYQEMPLIEPVSVYTEIENTAGRNKVEHLNVWDCTYYMRWKKSESNHIWLRYKNCYLRCIKTQFYNLEFAVIDIEENYEPIDCYMGFPRQTVFGEAADEYTVENRLYVSEKVFDSEDELLQDIENFRNTPDPIYTEIFNGIFGNG